MSLAIDDPACDDPAGLLAALDRGESLSARWYTDPAIIEAEIARVFRPAWNYLGPASELRNLGDYITGRVGGVPVAAIRNEDGLAGFVNVCRHRRHEVMKGRGNAKFMRCGYHAWTYDLAGCLKVAPRSAGEANFRLADYALLPLRVEALGPFVFVNFDLAAAPVQLYFGPLLEIIASGGVDLASLELHSREQWRSPANWKTMLENYLECYHCPVAHPRFSALIDVRPQSYELTAHRWFSSQIGQVRPSALQSGGKAGGEGEAAGGSKVPLYNAAGRVTQSQYHLLWPNTTISINPGFPNLSIDVWMPDGPNATNGFSEQYFAPGVSEEFAQELIAFNREVGAEDDQLTNSVQRGLLGGLPDRGRFLANSEHLVIHFQKLVIDAVTGVGKAPIPGFHGADSAVSRRIASLPDASAAPDSGRPQS